MSLSFSDFSCFFEWYSRNMALSDLRHSSLHSKGSLYSKEEGESEVSRISKNCIVLLFRFIFGCTGNWGRSGGGEFGGNWGGVCAGGWFCGQGIAPIDWLISRVGHWKFWNEIFPWVGWLIHYGGYKLFDVFFHEVMEYCWFDQEGWGNDWFF